MSSSDTINTTLSTLLPYVPTYKIRNIFNGWPSWNYPSLYEVYCTRGYTIPGERHPLIGTFFITQYALYVLIYIPSLVVIGSRPLIEHSCYKIMFAIGLLDITVGAFSTLGAGIFSLMGANYCDNTRLLIVAGHLLHCKSHFRVDYARYGPVGAIGDRIEAISIILKCFQRPGTPTA
jgi:hypothetical protein